MIRNSSAFSAFEAMGNAQMQAAQANHELAIAFCAAATRLLRRLLGRFAPTPTRYV